MRWYISLIAALLIFTTNAQRITISQQDAQKIGHRIWQNECNGTLEGLAFWNPHEQFASLGIGHFIWFPAGLPTLYQDTFPSFIDYARLKKRPVPTWLIKNDAVVACPYNNKDAFDRSKTEPPMQELQKFLVDTIDLQICFIIKRFQDGLNELLKSTRSRKMRHVRKHLTRLLSTQQGLYALIDYTNFKGTGLISTEHHNGHAWGLLQVLEHMPADGQPHNAIQDFVESARKVLEARVAHASPAKHEERFLPGWYNRLNTYTTFKQ